MSREIKFRAWDNENKCFFKPTYEAYNGKLEDLSIDFSGELMRRTLQMPAEHESSFPDRFILNQYTGLKDKNGKEIYEGDILDCTCELLTNFGRTRTGKEGTTIYEIFKREEGWGKRVLKSDTLVIGKESDGIAITAKYSVVIGNIYETPEALEKEI